MPKNKKSIPCSPQQTVSLDMPSLHTIISCHFGSLSLFLFSYKLFLHLYISFHLSSNYISYFICGVSMTAYTFTVYPFTHFFNTAMFNLMAPPTPYICRAYFAVFKFAFLKTVMSTSMDWENKGLRPSNTGKDNEMIWQKLNSSRVQ